jgi:hypothetical protein
MNERIEKFSEQARQYADSMYPSGLDIAKWGPAYQEKFAELIVQECIGILEAEIELVKGYKSTACNDFDVRWHQGKIEHFVKLVEKSKKHFGVEE